MTAQPDNTLLRIAFENPDEGVLLIRQDELEAMLRTADEWTRMRFQYAEYLLAASSSPEEQTWHNIRRYGYSCRVFIPYPTH